MISMICSVGKNRELGKKNQLVWHIPRDMKFFKKMTMGHVVVMGRKTYESLPGKLPGRKMIVISSNKVGDISVETVNNIDDVLDRYMNVDEEIFIIGGATLYKQFLAYADRLYLTEINDSDDEADTFFPEINKNEWNRTLIDVGEHNNITFEISIYDRKII